jgi:hypothetical protein
MKSNLAISVDTLVSKSDQRADSPLISPQSRRSAVSTRVVRRPRVPVLLDGSPNHPLHSDVAPKRGACAFADFHSSHAFDLLIACTLFGFEAAAVRDVASGRCLLSVGEVAPDDADPSQIEGSKWIVHSLGELEICVLPATDAHVDEGMFAIEEIVRRNQPKPSAPPPSDLDQLLENWAF